MSTTFAVTGSEKRTTLPWNVVEAHRAVIEARFGETLERLNGKGGVPFIDLVDAIEDDPKTTFDADSAEAYFAEMIDTLKSSGGLNVNHVGKLAAIFAVTVALFAGGGRAEAQVVGGAASLSVSAISARVALPSTSTQYPSVLIAPPAGQNQEIFYKFGDVSVSATTSDAAMPAGGICLNRGPNTYLAAITVGGTAALRITQLTTCPLFAR